ncbi:MAG TPA: tagaturonate reductase [Cyclobacteriaceae bacterium]|nr:tagaturonate reductase [Cyclobacteriaceae bacterium]
MPKKLNRQTVHTHKRPIKVLQFGEGNFLRAFCDWMVDILNEKTDFNGNVQIVQPIGQGMGAMINAQDGLYHVILNGKRSNEDRLITCVDSVLNPYDDYNKFLALAENPDLKFIFSNTTEAGITFNENDKSRDKLPDSFPGKVTALLYHRFEKKLGGLIFLPCELIEKNGTILKSVVEKYVDLWKLPSEFKTWLNANVLFCNTLVDRIVPGFPKETIHEIHQRTGYEDNLAVMAEPFHLWVIEAPESVRKSLPLEEAGLDVKFVSDLTPYRTRKVRILNGAHTALVPVAYLKGLRTVRESVDDKEVGSWLLKAIHEEIIPTLDLPKEELTKFANEVMERFQNPYIKHELSSIALNSVSKYKVRVLPSVLGYISVKNELPKRLLYSLAALIRFYKGEWKGEILPVNDSPDILEFFGKAWSTNDPTHVAKVVLGNVDFWGADLNAVAGLNKYVTESLKELDLNRAS